MKKMEDNSVDSIVLITYGLSFMGRAWDYDVPKVEIWEEASASIKARWLPTRPLLELELNIEWLVILKMQDLRLEMLLVGYMAQASQNRII